jgi:hypothetical protein
VSAAPDPENALRLPNAKKALRKPVPWDHLPHEPLTLEINSRISHREPSEADQEVRQAYLRERLKLLEREEHDEYINLVAIELKRELRICRDVYREHLKTINTKSLTAKARVALDFAVARMASRRLREGIIMYVRNVGVHELMFATLFFRLADRCAMHPNFTPEWLGIGNVIESVVPDSCFQELTEATPRELGALADGPFGDIVEPFERMVFPLKGGVKLMPNAIWDGRNLLMAYELCRLWDFVFREILAQHAALDCEEKSNVARALIDLTPFERLAGRMYYEESDRYLAHVPDDVFIRMGAELDKERILLADNLGAKGREILKYLGRQGKPIAAWKDALSDKSEYKFLPRPGKAATREEATTLKQFGTLSRCAKRAFYRAKDAYCQALEKVYEQRVPASMNANRFASKF